MNMKLYVLCTEQQKEDQSYYRLHGNSVLKTMRYPYYTITVWYISNETCLAICPRTNIS